MNKKVLIDKQALIDELMKIPGVGSNSDALETINVSHRTNRRSQWCRSLWRNG